ncbi:MAG: hypothetical protein BGO14_03835 [Chlamydiales bacterium 38-26]|nr:hypothetical protein [Chlamydiales bacterium]OJV09461.1 MAG: hypothetical protein BGO14_03835 [Chlamydiales bacterium 38-26]
MAFNIQTHNKNHGSLPQAWHAQQSDRPGYNKYEEKMGKARALFSWIGVVVLSIFSFSGYFIYLMKSKNGQQSLQNLKDRKIIHYVKNSGTDSSSSRKTDEVANQSLNPRPKSTTRFDPQTIIQKVDATVIKNCVQYSNKYKMLFSELEDLKKNKKTGLLVEALQNINPVMRQQLENLIWSDNFSEASFMETFAPFFKDISHLKDSIDRAKVLNTNQISENEKKFNDFRQRVLALKDSTAWLISLKHNTALFNYACDLVNFGEYYKYAFSDYIANSLWDACLKSMDDKSVDVNLDKAAYQTLKDDFIKHSELNKKCSEILFKDLYFNLYDYLSSKGQDFSDFRQIMSGNSMTGAYIKSYYATDSSYVSGQQDGVKEMYKSLKNELTPEIEQEAKWEAEARHRIKLQKEQEQEEGAKSDICKKSFQESKKIYNENHDTIQIISSVKPFLGFVLGKNGDKFFKFIDNLSASTEVKNYNEPTSYFYEKFVDHFSSLEGYKQALAHINQFKE